MASNLDEVVEEIFHFMETETGHDYNGINGRWVCECGLDLGSEDKYDEFESKRRAHLKDILKDIVVGYLDSQKDWDAEALKVLGL